MQQAENNKPQPLQIFHMLLNACVIMGLGLLCIHMVISHGHFTWSVCVCVLSECVMN